MVGSRISTPGGKTQTLVHSVRIQADATFPTATLNLQELQLCAKPVSSFTLYKFKSLSHSYLKVRANAKHKSKMADTARKIRK